MKIKNNDFDLFIVGQYPNSFSSQGIVNNGEWIISDDESLTEFLRAPCDYASQIKLNILQVYVKNERKNHLVQFAIQKNVHTKFDDPTSDVNAHLTQYNIFFGMNAPQYIMPSNMPTQFSIPDLKETSNESDRGLTLRDTNNVDLLKMTIIMVNHLNLDGCTMLEHLQMFIYHKAWILSIIVVLLLCPAAWAKNFYQDVTVKFGDQRAQIQDGGRILALSLDKISGSGFQFKNEYLFGRFDMQLKLVPENSVGTVTTFYLSNTLFSLSN
ncbi:Xyloglucan endotransglucosylase/hydrolase 2 [Capsicum baccatum]|uniref:Xyloglucan endotransglucosylase/hydrolase 2 n=1 Tax=Capsicum baccatum TaxID=33114 RepID=A0A2G2WG43_CAPBA|nr:Xyloglucan endotransglucosylase/hydrolase 2 [Capsicum baccatum]